MAKDLAVFVTALMKRPDLVHLTTSGDLAIIRDILFSLTARILRTPLSYHLHFGRVPQIAAANTIEWRMLALVLRMASVVIAVDRPTAETIRSLLNVRVEYIPNAVEISEFPSPVAGKNEPIALFLGWVLPTKGVEELLRAWSELAPLGWELLLAGPVSKAYKQEVIERHPSVRLRFLGELKHGDAMILMARCGIFVLPSHTEGFPYVVLEAMALGRPIIATSVGAIPEMLAEGCGVIIKPKDSQELRMALDRLIQDEQLRRQLGERAKRRVQERYSLDATFARYTRIWLSILPGRTR